MKLLSVKPDRTRTVVKVRSKVARAFRKPHDTRSTLVPGVDGQVSTRGIAECGNLTHYGWVTGVSVTQQSTIEPL